MVDTGARSLADLTRQPPPHLVRGFLLTALGLLVAAASITVLYLGMRDVMEIGGTCASGQTPYVIEDPCPTGTWAIPVSIFTGLAGLGIYALGALPLGGPRWILLAWPALFLSLGWNFWDYGLDPPGDATGLEWGWIVCAVLFVLMGGVPLIIALRIADARRRLAWTGSALQVPTIGLHLVSIAAGVLAGGWFSYAVT